MLLTPLMQVERFRSTILSFPLLFAGNSFFLVSFILTALEKRQRGSSHRNNGAKLYFQLCWKSHRGENNARGDHRRMNYYYIQLPLDFFRFYETGIHILTFLAIVISPYFADTATVSRDFCAMGKLKGDRALSRIVTSIMVTSLSLIVAISNDTRCV